MFYIEMLAVIFMMNRLKFILTSGQVEFKMSLKIERNDGIKKIKTLIDKEIGQDNPDNNYRIIGSLTNLNNEDTLTVIVERQSGNSRFDVLRGNFKILSGTSFSLSGHLENKCKIYGQLGVLIFFIGLSFYIAPRVANEGLLYFLIYPAVIVWLMADIYLRPTRALEFLKEKIKAMDQQSDRCD